MEQELSRGAEENNRMEIGFVPEEKGIVLLVNVNFFVQALKAFRDAVDARGRRDQINRILSATDWVEHYMDKQTGRRVLSDCPELEYEHEKRTAICLTQVNYDVLFAPKGMFQKNGKKFDVYLIRDKIILEADLKYITSKNPDTIANRIISGSYQAERIVLDLRSDIQTKDLIDGLRSGTGKNDLVKEILLFYKGKFYRLPRTLIWSKKIFRIF